LEALVPILVRPVREQLEHDRIIRLLEAKWKRKFKVEANPGDERNAGIKVPTGTIFPDLVLTEEGGRKPKALVEIETSESVNHLEARAQWAHLAKSRTSLVLFVPAGAVESARRLADENAIKVSELWTYLVLGDQVRFTSVFRENGLEPADLVEKADMFTTERTAPAPRPMPVEPPPPEPVEPPPAAERPRKLAVKVGSKGSIAELPSRAVGKVAAKAAPSAVPVAGKTAPAAAAAVKTAPAAKAAPAAAKSVPALPAAPAKPSTPAKAAKADAAPVAKAVVPAKAAEKKPADKGAPAKPAPKAAPEKAVAPAAPARKAPEKPAEKKVAAKAAPPPPAKAAAAKKVLPKPAPKPVKKAAPVKVAPKPVAAKPAGRKPPAKPAKAAAKRR
jgi:hypothetical protein